jgi:hypothetical protein
MTARRKDGKKDGGTAQPKAPDKTLSVAEVVGIFTDAFKESVYPELHSLAILDLFCGAVLSLGHYLKKGKVAGVNWKNPFALLDYPVGLIPSEEVEDADLEAVGKERLTKDAALDLLHRITVSLMTPSFLVPATMHGITREVAVAVTEAGDARIILPPDLEKEIAGLPEAEQEERLDVLGAGFDLPPLSFTGTCTTPAGKESFTAALVFGIKPLVILEAEDRAFFPVMVGLDFKEGDPSAWSEEDRQAILDFIVGQIDALAAPYLKAVEAKGEERPAVPEPDRAVAVRAGDFAVAGGYPRPIYGLSKRKEDLPLLREYHEPQTPLNWAVGLALFSMTDEDRVRSGDFQEARIADLADRVFCLTDRDAPRRGDHRSDILAEVVKLATTHNWYYTIETVKVGRAWKKRAIIGVQTAIPELHLVFLDTKTGERVFPTDPALRALAIPLEVKGRRVAQPDGSVIRALPKGRWKLESIRWRWVQSFNDDLLLTPALVESGKRKGLPKKTTGGKVIRKGYLIRVADNVFAALHGLRAEGRGSMYACRLLVMLAHNLNKTESDIAADRVFRMLGIPEDYESKTHKKREDLVAAAVLRLKQRDIGALLVGSDEYPRTDPNPDRRKGPYYRFIWSPEYTPRTGIASKADAETIEAEYADAVEEDTVARSQPAPVAQPKADQAVLPGMEEPPAPPIPDGSVIRAAREAAGLNLRRFAKAMAGPSFKTWSLIETGQRTERSGRIPEAVWQRVRDFIAQHGPKAGTDGKLSHKGGDSVA